MARAGIVLNLLGVVLVTLISYYVAMPVFDVVPGAQVLVKP
jgi:hypothetical protein